MRFADSFAEGLVAAAEEFGASHIVVGAANGGLRGRHRLGSVATELLHSSHVPVVLAPEGSRRIEPATGVTRITAAIGTRPGADALLDEATSLAADTGAELRLLSLVTVDLPASVDTGVIRIAGAAHADQVLAQARAGLPGDGDTEVIVGRGDSIEDAVSHLSWEPGEVAIVGSSRLAQPRRLFLGSTAAKMLHELPVPMIVVPRTRAAGRRVAMSERLGAAAPLAPTAGKEAGGLSAKGLSAGTVGLIGAVVIGISCIAPAYTLTAALGPTVSEVGFQVPAIILIGFIPMLLVAFGYRELNRQMPDSGTSFTWAARAFGPWVGWMAGWGLIAATILVLSNLAGIAVEFLFLLIDQIAGSPGTIAELAFNPFINVAVCLLFMLGATLISYRDMQTTQKLQYVLVTFQVLVLVIFSVAAFVHVAQGNAFDASPVELSWFNPFAVGSFTAVVAGLSLSIFIFWGWDVTLTMNEETKDPEKTPGRAATLTVITIVVLYLLISVSLLAYAGTGVEDLGLGNEDIQANVFFFLSGPILGPLAFLVSLAVLTSSASSLQSTFVSPARTLLAMGHYGALPPRFAEVSPRFFTPGFATIVSAIIASVFYAIMRFVNENVLWDTITTLGLMICFYYGITAFACVWYFRKQWFDSTRSVFFTLLFPLVGGLILAALFVITLVESMDPDYGSGTEWFGLGSVFVLGVGIIGLGLVIMIWQAIKRPAYFRGETLSLDAPASLRRARR